MSALPIPHSAAMQTIGRVLVFESMMQQRISLAAQRIADLEVYFKRRASVDLDAPLLTEIENAE